MTSVVRRIKRVWSAEEIPPWMGLSMVTVVVVAVGVSAHLSVEGAFSGRHRAVHEQSAQRAFDLLILTLGNLDPSDAANHQRAVRAFADAHPCSILRTVASDGVVVASLHPDEIGRPRAPHAELGTASPTELESRRFQSRADGRERLVLRSPVATRPVQGEGQEPLHTPEYIEVILDHEVEAPSVWTMSTMITALTAVGAFLVLYRLMRRHLQSVVRIADNLVTHGEHIEQNLTALRLADESGQVAAQWNRLIDLVESLTVERRRSDASTELMQALEKSKRGELAEVVDIVPDGLLYVAEKNELVYANTVARRLLGIDAAPTERVSLESLSVQATGRAILDCVASGTGADGTYLALSETVSIEGQDTTYRVRVLPFGKRRSRSECVVMISDISQQVRAERASGEFVSQVTHELRTPLTNIRAYAETLSSGVFDDPKVITECYNVITKETRRLSRLIEDVLSMSQLEVGSIQLQLDDVDLRTLLTDSVRDLRGLADEKRIDMQLSLPSKLPTPKGDRDKLAVVLNNLLGNALKYTPEGGQVVLSCQIKTDKVLIIVKDNGMGVDPEDHEKIFQKFSRGSAPEVASIQGTGIGLTTAREIVRRHGGDIEIVSARGEGATFIVQIPCASAVANFSAVAAGAE